MGRGGASSVMPPAEGVALQAHREVGRVAHLEAVRRVMSPTARRELVPKVGGVVLTATRRSGVPDHRHRDP